MFVDLNSITYYNNHCSFFEEIDHIQRNHCQILFDFSCGEKGPCKFYYALILFLKISCIVRS